MATLEHASCVSTQAFGYTTDVSDDPEIQTRKLNAIVGAAIKALAASGADDEFVGDFAAAHRLHVANVLGHEQAQPVPDLVSIVTQAVGQALAQAGVVSAKRVDRAAPARRIHIMLGGRRTSVSISPVHLDALVRQKGGLSKARTVIEELGNAAPTSVDNRSGWIEERLVGMLRASSVPDAGQGPVH